MEDIRLSASFKKYADYYDLIYKDKNYKKEATFLDSIFKKNKIKKKARLLELGCGTGRLAFELVKLGYSIDGIDLSKKMIARAKKVDISGLNFEIGDVRNYRGTKPFDLVISLFHVVSYQLTYSDLIKTFESANSNLKKNNHFIFDCWYGPAVLTLLPQKKYKQTKINNITLSRVATPTLFENENIVDVKYIIRVCGNNIENTTFEETHRVRYFFKSEIEYFLNQTGFELVDNFEWMTSKPLSNKTWGSCFVAKKIREI